MTAEKQYRDSIPKDNPQISCWKSIGDLAAEIARKAGAK